MSEWEKLIGATVKASIKAQVAAETKRLEGLANLKPGDSVTYMGVTFCTVKYPGIRGVFEALKTAKSIKFGKQEKSS